MAISNTALKVSEIDFDNIRDSLKNYLGSQQELLDYDFDSSTIAMILDILAYNTYHQSFYLNMVANEAFLGSAVRRENIVSRAKEIGYTPRSAHGATAYLNVTISPDDDPASVQISKNERFTTSIDDITYTFVTPEETTITANTTGGFTANLEIVEGEPLTHRWTVDTQNPQNYIIPNDLVDTRSLLVEVKESEGDSSRSKYSLASDLTEITANSEAYFLQETSEGRFEIYFGDDILGKSLSDDNVIIVNYRVCNGDVTNGANSFTSPSTLGGYSDFTVNNIIKASGGDSRESLNSIKFNAPKSYESQGRVITTNDYKTLIKNNFGDVQSISVWGGEDNNPPKYGKVYVSIKPKTGNSLSESRKEEVLTFLDARSALSIDPVIKDPSFLYLVTHTILKFDPNKTDKSPSGLLSDVGAVIKEYESDQIGQFGENFIHSELLGKIDDVSSAITSVQTSLTLQRKISPVLGSKRKYLIDFGQEIMDVGYRDALTSSKFTFQGQSGCKLDVSDDGTVRVYFVKNASRIYLSTNEGTLDFSNGVLSLDSLLVESFEGDSFRIEVVPKNLDVSPLRNQILLLSDTIIDAYDNNVEKIVSTTSVTTDGSTTDLNENAIYNTSI